MNDLKEEFKITFGRRYVSVFRMDEFPCAVSGLAQRIGVETKPIEVFNPATGKTIGFALEPILDKKLVKKVEEDARRAQEVWHHKVSEQEKEAVFRAIISLLEKYRGALARTMILEGGKLWRWADAEVTETIDTLWHYHGEISRCYSRHGFSRCQMPDKNAFSVRKPYGVFLSITPWNFPLAVPFWKICSQLAGGNAVVVKDAEQTPFTLSIAVELIHRAIKDALGGNRAEELNGLVQLIHGQGETAGDFLVKNLNYDKLSFTGSSEIGFRVASIAAGRGIPSYLELGGHAAIVVLDDFDIDLAVAEAINANLGDSGQRCVSARVVFVQENKFREFVRKYQHAANKRIVGNPMDFESEMGPLISQEQVNRVLNQINNVAGGYRDFSNGGRIRKEEEKGCWVSPIMFTNVPYGKLVMDEEVFGPVIVINPLPGKNREEAFWNAVKLVNQSRQGLSNSLLTNDRLLASRAPWVFESGIFYIGRGPTGAELNKAFGGIKRSGWGREGRGIDETTYEMQIYDDYRGEARMAQAGADEKVKEIISEAKSPFED
ncbi:MAG: aldehyde dehydrogenase [Candidatus Niyogibacteria bacterium]|nr:aldehyde dehydrogenase [Candidatus Niyogibacteria bacterium]